MTDEELMDQLKGGEATAFADLFYRHRGRLARIAAISLRNRADGEDVAHEVLKELFERPHAFRKGSLRAYLGAVTRNRARDILRKRESGPVMMPLEDDEEHEHRYHPRTPDPESAVREDARYVAVERALQALPREDAEMFILRKMHDTPYPEIAELYAKSIEAVRTSVMRTKQRLRKTLTDEPPRKEVQNER